MCQRAARTCPPSGCFYLLFFLTLEPAAAESPIQGGRRPNTNIVIFRTHKPGTARNRGSTFFFFFLIVH